MNAIGAELNHVIRKQVEAYKQATGVTGADALAFEAGTYSAALKALTPQELIGLYRGGMPVEDAALALYAIYRNLARGNEEFEERILELAELMYSADDLRAAA